MKSMDLSKHVQYIANYLMPMSSDGKLRELYSFPIGKPLNKFGEYVRPAPAWIGELSEALAKNSKDCFSATLELREKFPAELSNADQATVVRMAEWIVKEWGGIPIGNDLSKCINMAEASHGDGLGKFEFERIASWSKFLAFKYPNMYAIYDARVVYSLNWILLTAGAEKFLPVLEGRNSVMGLLDYKLRLLLTVHEKQSIEDALSKRQGSKTHFLSSLEKDVFFDKPDAFSIYCNLLRKVAGEIYQGDEHGLTKVEMLLFSIADRDIALDVLRKTI